MGLAFAVDYDSGQLVVSPVVLLVLMVVAVDHWGRWKRHVVVQVALVVGALVAAAGWLSMAGVMNQVAGQAVPGAFAASCPAVVGLDAGRVEMMTVVDVSCHHRAGHVAELAAPGDC